MCEQLKIEAATAARLLCAAAKLKAGDLMVVGCSTSEILGEKIGTSSSSEAATAVFEGICSVLQPQGIFLAAQCCEHLNRALIVEAAVAAQFGLEIVNVIPVPKAGGSFATAAFAGFLAPVAVESLCQKATAGLDIGKTLIGMHLRPVVVPVRTEIAKIGQADLIFARSRPKFVGGARAQYDETLM